MDYNTLAAIAIVCYTIAYMWDSYLAYSMSDDEEEEE